MNSNRKNSNNFLLGVSSNKNNSLENFNNFLNSRNDTNSPLETKKIVFGIIDKLESDIIKLNNKINSLNKEKIELKNLNNKEIRTLKEVIKKLHMILSFFYKSSNLSKNDTINLLKKLKNTIEQNESFMKITNKIVRNDKIFNNIIVNQPINNLSLINESTNNNVSLSNIIAKKNSENISRMNDNAFLKRQQELINNGINIPQNVYSNNNPSNNDVRELSNNNSSRPLNNDIRELSNNNSGQRSNNNLGRPLNNNSGQRSNNNLGRPLNNNSGQRSNNNLGRPLNNNSGRPLNNNSGQRLNNNLGRPLNNNSGQRLNNNMYKSENKELLQSKRIPLINKINEHKLSQEKSNQNFNEYKKFL
jgi:hypothetical protein